MKKFQKIVDNFDIAFIFLLRFEATDTTGGNCDADEVCIGGYARTVYTVKRLLEEQKANNAIYINAGDSFQGTLWYNVGRWNVTSQFLNMLPADAMVSRHFHLAMDAPIMLRFLCRLWVIMNSIMVLRVLCHL